MHIACSKLIITIRTAIFFEFKYGVINVSPFSISQFALRFWHIYVNWQNFVTRRRYEFLKFCARILDMCAKKLVITICWIMAKLLAPLGFEIAWMETFFFHFHEFFRQMCLNIYFQLPNTFSIFLCSPQCSFYSQKYIQCFFIAQFIGSSFWLLNSVIYSKQNCTVAVT